MVPPLELLQAYVPAGVAVNVSVSSDPMVCPEGLTVTVEEGVSVAITRPPSRMYSRDSCCANAPEMSKQSRMAAPTTRRIAFREQLIKESRIRVWS